TPDQVSALPAGEYANIIERQRDARWRDADDSALVSSTPSDADVRRLNAGLGHYTNEQLDAIHARRQLEAEAGDNTTEEQGYPGWETVGQARIRMGETAGRELDAAHEPIADDISDLMEAGADEEARALAEANGYRISDDGQSLVNIGEEQQRWTAPGGLVHARTDPFWEYVGGRVQRGSIEGTAWHNYAGWHGHAAAIDEWRRVNELAPDEITREIIELRGEGQVREAESLAWRTGQSVDAIPWTQVNGTHEDFEDLLTTLQRATNRGRDRLDPVDEVALLNQVTEVSGRNDEWRSELLRSAGYRISDDGDDLTWLREGRQVSMNDDAISAERLAEVHIPWDQIDGDTHEFQEIVQQLARATDNGRVRLPDHYEATLQREASSLHEAGAGESADQMLNAAGYQIDDLDNIIHVGRDGETTGSRLEGTHPAREPSEMSELEMRRAQGEDLIRFFERAREEGNDDVASSLLPYLISAGLVDDDEEGGNLAMAGGLVRPGRGRLFRTTG
ncbi:unnamed protein product, partial [marine sediment metagenome]